MNPSEINWLGPWHPLNDALPYNGLVEELRRELLREHVLFNVHVRPVATRRDCDDVLFELLDGSGRLAVVHLTYAQHPEPDPRWPETRLFLNCEEFQRDGMNEGQN
jgi:hypothetical protein